MDDRTSVMISMLALLVHRRGGHMKIENISDLTGKDLDLTYLLNEKDDSIQLEATLKTRKDPGESMGGLGGV